VDYEGREGTQKKATDGSRSWVLRVPPG